MKKLVYFTGTFTAIITLLGVLLNIMHWQFGPITSGLLLVPGLIGFSLIFIPLFVKYSYDRD
jgi:hypothetical protein